MPKPKRKTPQARFTPALAGEICRRLSAGESLVSICRDRDIFP